MSSDDLQSVVELLITGNYSSLAIVTAVVYDYFLTFPREVDYVWRRSWTWVSTIFVLVRYLGLCWAILSGLGSMTFVPIPPSVSPTIYLVPTWSFQIFLNAADLVMVLRVYAMWNRSKWILWFLLFTYVPQVVCSFVFVGIYDNPRTHFSTAVVQLAGFSFCNGSWSGVPRLLDIYAATPRIVFGTALLVLAVTQTLQQSVSMYRATKQWQPNRYIQQFTSDGILYFLVNMLVTVSALVLSGPAASRVPVLIVMGIPYISVCPLMPRFIISVRELYDSDLRRRWEGLDTGFGIMSQSQPSQNMAMSVIAFAGGQGEVAEGDADNEQEGARPEASGDDDERQV